MGLVSLALVETPYALVRLNATDGDRREAPKVSPHEHGAMEASSTQIDVGEERDLSASETAALRRVRSLSTLLDSAIRIPGTNYRVGLDPILGVLPVAGDAVAAALSLYPVAEAYRLGAPKRTLLWMLGLVAVDAVIGSVPLVGGVFDALWKANEWNRRTLERHVLRE